MIYSQKYNEKLFSYGTLKYEIVQLATLRRKLNGIPDVLKGYYLSLVITKDQNNDEATEQLEHTIITYTGNDFDYVHGIVFDISLEELTRADIYEITDYKRIKVQLVSGAHAWVYINAKK